MVADRVVAGTERNTQRTKKRERRSEGRVTSNEKDRHHGCVLGLPAINLICTSSDTHTHTQLREMKEKEEKMAEGYTAITPTREGGEGEAPAIRGCSGREGKLREREGGRRRKQKWTRSVSFFVWVWVCASSAAAAHPRGITQQNDTHTHTHRGSTLSATAARFDPVQECVWGEGGRGPRLSHGKRDGAEGKEEVAGGRSESQDEGATNKGGSVLVRPRGTGITGEVRERRAVDQ